MGILNATPDSFHDSSRAGSVAEAVEVAGNMLADGASILDIGGQSTRPGAERISAEEEIDRSIPLIKALSHQFPEAILSIDTFYAKVAELALAEGAHIVNDVSAGTIDREILTIPGKYGAPYVLMHMKGVPSTMQADPSYDNVVTDLLEFFGSKINQLIASGTRDIIIDPGFGFGKTLEHNYTILGRLEEFNTLGHPIMVGVSRKGMLRNHLGNSAEEALNATTAANTIALMHGAKILRVHDVKEAKEAIEVYALLPN